MTRDEAVKAFLVATKALDLIGPQRQRAENLRNLVNTRFSERRLKIEKDYTERKKIALAKVEAERQKTLQAEARTPDEFIREEALLKKRIAEITQHILNPSPEPSSIGGGV